MLDALEEVTAAIVEAVHWVLERTPPELTGDISANGITMTGGGSLIWGFDKLVASKTGIPTRIADEAISCVAYGTGNCLENLSENAGRHDESIAAKTNESALTLYRGGLGPSVYGRQFRKKLSVDTPGRCPRQLSRGVKSQAHVPTFYGRKSVRLYAICKQIEIFKALLWGR